MVDSKDRTTERETEMGQEPVTLMDADSSVRNFINASGHLSELPTAQATWSRHAAFYESKGLTGENSTSLEDCFMLYLLIRHFDRRCVFEIGTNVGTTSVIMNEAVRKNGGTCITCDPVDYGALPPDSGIRFIHAQSDAALALLETERRTIDFAFFDWIPDKRTLTLANELFDPSAIIAVHDYKLDPKGEAIVDVINLHYRPRGRWFFPETAPIQLTCEIRVNICTAFFVPNQLLRGARESALERLKRGLSILRHPRMAASHVKRTALQSIRRI
jgi:hypothetical protein